jgi:Cd2+/Zn2+-exporting ATPase
MFGADGAVGMVGDGINDAPRLGARPHRLRHGAMGTDTAIETADVALMTTTTGARFLTFVRLSQATRRCWSRTS